MILIKGATNIFHSEVAFCCLPPPNVFLFIPFCLFIFFCLIESFYFLLFKTFCELTVYLLTNFFFLSSLSSPFLASSKSRSLFISTSSESSSTATLLFCLFSVISLIFYTLFLALIFCSATIFAVALSPISNKLTPGVASALLPLYICISSSLRYALGIQSKMLSKKSRT